MSVNNSYLHALVDEAVHPGGLINHEALHTLLHVIVSNGNWTCSIKTDLPSDGASESVKDLLNTVENQKKSSRTTESKKPSTSVTGAPETIKNLKNTVQDQKKQISQLQIKLQNLENKVRPRSTNGPSNIESSTKPITIVKTPALKTPPKTSSGEWTTFKHAGKVSPKAEQSNPAADASISDLKRWLESKLKALPPISANIRKDIDRLIAKKIASTDGSDLKQMIESMIVQSYKEQRSGQSAETTVPLCLSCRDGDNGTDGRQQVSSGDCICLLKRKLRNASSRVNVPKK